MAERERGEQDSLPPAGRAAQRERDGQMASGSTDWSISAVAWIYGHDSGTL